MEKGPRGELGGARTAHVLHPLPRGFDMPNIHQLVLDFTFPDRPPHREPPTHWPLAARVLARRYVLPIRRAALVAELAGLHAGGRYHE